MICPDKLVTDEWLEVMATAHDVGLRSTATIMFGHVDGYEHWARHLRRIRGLQDQTGGFTEFVPLPFVHMEAPLWRKGVARSGPVFREALLMHAVARLVLHPSIAHVQASWVKMGAAGAALALRAGADDLGGTLMNESITRAAGGAHGQEMTADRLRALAADAGRRPWQRTTLYRPAPVRAAEASLAPASWRGEIAEAAAPGGRVVNARNDRPTCCRHRRHRSPGECAGAALGAGRLHGLRGLARRAPRRGGCGETCRASPGGRCAGSPTARPRRRRTSSS